MSGAAHTADGLGIAPGAQKRPFTPSAADGRKNARPTAADAPRGAESAFDAKRAKRREAETPRRVLARAKQATLGMEEAGTLLAASVGAMDAARRLPKAERDAAWLAEWREIQAVLADHADAMAAFLGGFMDAPCFRRTARAAQEAEYAERRAEVVGDLADGGEPQDGEGGAA